jgi:hypothetical protein
MLEMLRARSAGVVILVALPWLNPMSLGPSAAVMPWLVSALCGSALWLLGGGLRPAVPPRGLAWAAAALCLWAGLWHLPVRPELVMLAAGLLLVLLCAAAARQPELAGALQAGLLAAAALNAGIGLAQYFGLSSALAPFVNVIEAGEAFGNLRQTNQFATLCWIGAAIVLFGTLQLRMPARLALVVLLAAAGAASASRTGVLEAVALGVLVAWWRGPDRRSRLALYAAGAAAYVMAAMLLPVLLEAVTGIVPERRLWARFGGGEGCFSRWVLWSNVLELIALKPLAGWGWGELDYAHYLTLYPGARFCEILDNAHNLPLHLAVELGVPAAVVACGGALVWVWRQRPWVEALPLRQLAWTLLALLLLHSLLEYPLWYGSFQMTLGLALGWLLPCVKARSAERWRPAVAMAGLIAGIAYAGWDYARVTQVYLPPQERRAAWRDDPLRHVRDSWLFSGQARFADLTLGTLTRSNAESMYRLSEEVLHYSPEPRVIERAIESAVLTGRDHEAVMHLARYRAAFPKEFGAWRAEQRRPLPTLP